MNERIKELAVQCGAWNQPYNPHRFMVDRTFDVGKFAELIVRECAGWIENTDSDPEIGKEDAQALLEYFGVEE